MICSAGLKRLCGWPSDRCQGGVAGVPRSGSVGAPLSLGTEQVASLGASTNAKHATPVAKGGGISPLPRTSGTRSPAMASSFATDSPEEESTDVPEVMQTEM